MTFDQLDRSGSLARVKLQRTLPDGSSFDGHSGGPIFKVKLEATRQPLGKMEMLDANQANSSQKEVLVSSGSAKTKSKRMNTNKIVTRSIPIAATNKFSTQHKKTSRINNSNKLAFLALITLPIILILLTCLTNQRVSALNCITCSSADNPGCDETYSANISDTNCEPYIGKPAKVCRKIVQYVENKKVVIRSCGWIDEHEDKKPMCYKRSGTFALMMESCICYEDNCNHSASLVPNQSVLISLACGSTIFFYLMAGQHRRGAAH